MPKKGFKCITIKESVYDIITEIAEKTDLPLSRIIKDAVEHAQEQGVFNGKN